MDSIRVHAPVPVVFLCGGKIDVTAADPPSLREAFSRVFHGHPSFGRYTLLMAEDVNAFFPEGKYKDILSFEADIAQIAELIVLFSESFGAAAELGAFAMVPEIASRMLTVLDDYHYDQRSFITLGPVKLLTNKYDESVVCVLDRKDIGIASIDDLTGINMKKFAERMTSAFKKRHDFARHHTKFDKARDGHLMKLVTGIIQHYGALTFDEVSLFVEALGAPVPAERLEDFLLCARFVGWIKPKKFGVLTYFVAKDGNEALQFSQRKGPSLLDKDRWRMDIREYWRAHDPDRHEAISAVLAEGRP